jgi:SAM-dependent methyltransferase
VSDLSDRVENPSQRPAPAEAHQLVSAARPRLVLSARQRLLLASFLMLFIELALIRWTAANVIHLIYLTNFVLLASFLGIGVGFLRARASRDLFPLAPVVLAALVVFILAFPVSVTALSGDHQLEGLFGMPPLPRWVSLPVIFLLTVAVMAMIAEEVARAFGRFEPLEAYRLDVLGSIGGIVAFSALSFLQLPPLAWGLLAAVGFVTLLGTRTRRWQWVALAVMVLLLGAQSLLPIYHWSPYYKVRATEREQGRALSVSANNVPHQVARPVERLRTVAPFYFFPYRHLEAGDLDDVLVIGAGTGNDVAVALAHGAKRVDAVEIDPALQRLGRAKHPDRPYQDPRVRAHINDGRAFLEQTGRRYDLIVLALTDSLTVVSGQSSLRLENYLFTVEAMRQARAHLKPDGVFAMYNYYEPWLLQRYAGTVVSVYGNRPCVELADPLGARRQAVLTISADGSARNCAATWRQPAVVPEPATDDHPFPYVTGRSIPLFYLWTLALLLVASLLLVRLTAGPLRGMTPYVDLCFMGAAFLLLETKNVVQFALLFGTTWFVNAAVFAGILLSVLAAVEVARRVRLPRPWRLYTALLAALAVAWVIPQAALLDLSPPVRFLAATLIAFTPIFLANLVFAQRFKDVGSSTVAFGANLLGAMVGGMLEYLSLVGGYRWLLIVVAVLYGLAFLSGRWHFGAVAP